MGFTHGEIPGSPRFGSRFPDKMLLGGSVLPEPDLDFHFPFPLDAVFQSGFLAATAISTYSVCLVHFIGGIVKRLLWSTFQFPPLKRARKVLLGNRHRQAAMREGIFELLE